MLKGLENEMMEVPKDKEVKDLDPLSNLFVSLKVFSEKKNFQIYLKASTKPKTSLGIGLSPQKTEEVKIYDNGYLISKSLTKGIVNVARERFTSDDYYFLRMPKKIGSGLDDIEWNEAQLLTKDAFIDLFGSNLRQYTPYVCNRKSIVKSEFIGVENGVYHFRYVFDNTIGPAKYAHQVQQFSDSKTFPLFEELTLDVYMNDKWEVLKTESFEKYTINPPAGGNVECSYNGTQTVEYNNVPIKELDYYKSRFNEKPNDDINISKDPFTILQEAMEPYLKGNGFSGQGETELYGEKLNFKFSYDQTNKKATFNVHDKIFGLFEANKIKVKFNAFEGVYELTSLGSSENIVENPAVKAIIDNLTSEIVGDKIILSTNYKGLKLKFYVDKETHKLLYLSFSYTIAGDTPLVSGMVTLNSEVKLEEISFGNNLTDLTHLVNLAKVLIKNKRLQVGFSYPVKFKDLEMLITGDFLVSFANEIKVMGTFNIYVDGKEYKVKLKVLNDTVYLEFFNGQKIKLTTLDFKEIIDALPSDLKKLNIEKIFKTISSLDLKLKENHVLAELKNFKASLKTLPEDFIVSVENQNEYEDYKEIVSTVKDIFSTLGKETLEFKINYQKEVNGVNISFTGSLFFNIKTKELYFSGVLKLGDYEVPVSFKRDSEKTYYRINSKLGYIYNDEIKLALAEFLEELKASELYKTLSLEKLAGKFLDSLFFTKTSFGSEIDILDNKYQIIYEDKVLRITGTGFSVITNSEETSIVFPSFEEASHNENLKPLVKFLRELLNKKALSFSVKTKVNENLSLEGDGIFNVFKKSLEFNGVLKGKEEIPFKALVIDKNIYLTLGSKTYEMTLDSLLAFLKKQNIILPSFSMLFSSTNVSVTENEIHLHFGNANIKATVTEEQPLLKPSVAVPFDEALDTIGEFLISSNKNFVGSVSFKKTTSFGEIKLDGNLSLDYNSKKIKFTGSLTLVSKTIPFSFLYKDGKFYFQTESFSSVLKTETVKEIIAELGLKSFVTSVSALEIINNLEVTVAPNLLELKFNEFNLSLTKTKFTLTTDLISISMEPGLGEFIEPTLTNEVQEETVREFAKNGKDFIKKLLKDKKLYVSFEKTLEVYKKEIYLTFQAYIDLTNGFKAKGMIDVTVGSVLYTINFVFIDNKLFLDTPKGKFVLTVPEAKEYLGKLGIDLKETKLPKIVETIFDGSDLTVKTEKLEIFLKAVDTVPQIEKPEESEYTGLGNILDRVVSLKKTLTSEFIQLNITFEKTVENETLHFTGLLSFNTKTKDLVLKGELSFLNKTYEFEIVKKDDKLYYNLLDHSGYLTQENLETIFKTLEKHLTFDATLLINETISNLNLNEFKTVVTLLNSSYTVSFNEDNLEITSGENKVKIAKGAIVNPGFTLEDAPHNEKLVELSNVVDKLLEKKFASVNGSFKLSDTIFNFIGKVNLKEKKAHFTLTFVYSGETLNFEFFVSDSKLFFKLPEHDDYYQISLSELKKLMVLFKDQTFDLKKVLDDVIWDSKKITFANSSFNLELLPKQEETIVVPLSTYLDVNLDDFVSYLKTINENQKLDFDYTKEINGVELKVSGTLLFNIKERKFYLEGSFKYGANEFAFSISYLDTLKVKTRFVELDLSFNELKEIIGFFDKPSFKLSEIFKNVSVETLNNKLLLGYKGFKAKLGTSVEVTGNSLIASIANTSDAVSEAQVTNPVNSDKVKHFAHNLQQFITTLKTQKALELKGSYQLKEKALVFSVLVNLDNNGISGKGTIEYGTQKFDFKFKVINGQISFEVFEKIVLIEKTDIAFLKQALKEELGIDLLNSKNIFDFLNFDSELNLHISKELLKFDDLILSLTSAQINVSGSKTNASVKATHEETVETVLDVIPFNSYHSLIRKALNVLNKKEGTFNFNFDLTKFNIAANFEGTLHVSFANDYVLYGKATLTFNDTVLKGSQEISFKLTKDGLTFFVNDKVNGFVKLQDLLKEIEGIEDFKVKVELLAAKIKFTLNKDLKDLLLEYDGKLKLTNDFVSFEETNETIALASELEGVVNQIDIEVIKDVIAFTKHKFYHLNAKYIKDKNELNLDGNLEALDNRKVRMYLEGEAKLRGFGFEIKVGYHNQYLNLQSDNFKARLKPSELLALFKENLQEINFLFDIPDEFILSELLSNINLFKTEEGRLKVTYKQMAFVFHKNGARLVSDGLEVNCDSNGVSPEELQITDPLVKSDIDEIIRAISLILKLKEVGSNKYTVRFNITEKGVERYHADATFRTVIENNKLKLHIHVLVTDTQRPNEQWDVTLVYLDEMFYVNYNGLGFKIGLLELQKVLRSIVDYKGIQNKIIDKILNEDLNGPNPFGDWDPSSETGQENVKRILKHLKDLKITGNEIYARFAKEIYEFVANDDLEIRIKSGTDKILQTRLTNVYLNSDTKVNVINDYVGDSEPIDAPSWDKIIDLRGCEELVYAALNSATLGKWDLRGYLEATTFGLKIGFKQVETQITLNEKREPTVALRAKIDWVPGVITRQFWLYLYYHDHMIYYGQWVNWWGWHKYYYKMSEEEFKRDPAEALQKILLLTDSMKEKIKGDKENNDPIKLEKAIVDYSANLNDHIHTLILNGREITKRSDFKNIILKATINAKREISHLNIKTGIPAVSIDGDFDSLEVPKDFEIVLPDFDNPDYIVSY